MSLLLASDFARKIATVRAVASAEGIAFEVTQAWRPVEVQEELLACWNDPTNDYECRKRRGIVAQPAKPGWSYHNWARAIDFKVLAKPSNMSLAEASKRVGVIAEEEGLRYGGPGSVQDKFDYDVVHIDDGKAYTIYTARSLFDKNDLVEVM